MTNVLHKLFTHGSTRTMSELTITSRLIGNNLIKSMSNPTVPVRDIYLSNGKLLEPGNLVTKHVTGIPGNMETCYLSLTDKDNRARTHQLIVEEYPIDYMVDRFQQFKKDLRNRGRIMVTGVKTTTSVASKERTVKVINSWTMEEFYSEYRTMLGDSIPDPILKLDRDKVKRELGFEVHNSTILTTVRNIHGLIVIPTPILQKDETGEYDYLLLGFGTEG